MPLASLPPFREAVTIVEEFKLCLTELEQEESMGMVPLELMDPNVARIYSKSRRAKVRTRFDLYMYVSCEFMDSYINNACMYNWVCTGVLPVRS